MRQLSTEPPNSIHFRKLIIAVTQVDGNHQNWSLTEVVECEMANLWPQLWWSH